MTKEQTPASLWERLEKTDPAYTKPFKGKGGFSGTAINATYIIKRLTEEFGSCGVGWKLILDDEQIVEGHKLKSGDTAKIHIVRCHIDYRPLPHAEFVSTSPQFGQTMLVDENKYGTFTDEEAPKKSITDCLSKCAVLLGIAADVHLGLFDDNKYVNQRRVEEAAEKGEPLPQDTDVTEGVKNWVTKQKSIIDAATRLPDLYMWLDENGGEWNKPASGTSLDRLKRKAPEAFAEISRYYQAKVEALSKS